MTNLLLALIAGSALIANPNVLEFHIGFGTPIGTISPYVYGANDTPHQHVPWTIHRFGGNAATTYNWETNFDNAGSDWQQSSGYGWSMRHTPESMRTTPAAAIINHHETSLKMGAESIIQVNLMGFVAADGNGPVTEAEQAPSKRWKRVVPKKPGPFEFPPNTDDDVIYVDEMVHHLVQKYGRADSERGILAYSLDNEPGLWDHTHPRAFQGKTPAKLLVERSIATASAIKDVDPTALIHGFAPFGVYEYVALTGSPDWPEIASQNDYAWFIDYYLEEFRKAEETQGRRLLDVLDLHFYVGGMVIDEGGLDGHLQAPRAMWDPTYKEQSWLGEVHPEFFPLIPRIMQSIDRYYPGTKLCFSEWNTERPMTLPGALSTADMLGVFGRSGLFAATWWGLLPQEATEEQLLPSRAAFKLFRDFDGNGGKFGDALLDVHNPRPDEVSVYAARDTTTGTDHLVLVSKRRHVPITVRIPLRDAGTRLVRSFGFGDEWGLELAERDNARIVGEFLEVRMPKKSAAHVVLARN